jgi:hypothetical protein
LHHATCINVYSPKSLLSLLVRYTEKEQKCFWFYGRNKKSPAENCRINEEE